MTSLRAMATGMPTMEATTYTTPSDLEIAFARVFDAPRQRVFDAWTSPEVVPHWIMAPDGWTMTVCDIDLRPGGAWRFEWRGRDGALMGMGGVYQEVVPGERLVSTESWGGHWPDTLNTLVVREEGGRTAITNTVRYPTREARDAALATGMARGVEASHDRLAEHLRTRA